MARKAYAGSEEWAAAKYFVASAGYAPMKPTGLLGATAVRGSVIELRLDDGTGCDEAIDDAGVRSFASIASAAQALLLPGEDANGLTGLSSSGADLPQAIVVLDLAPLLAGKSNEPASAILDGEGSSSGPPGKLLGKPAARALEKLLGGGMHDAVLLAQGGAAQLVLKLLNARALRTSSIKRIVLLHPRLSTACVNAQLSTVASGDLSQLPVDVVFGSAAVREKREPMLRHAFPLGRTDVADSQCKAALWLRAVLPQTLMNDASGQGSPHTTEATHHGPAAPLHALPRFDPTAADEMGRTMWLSELSFEMSRQTKQHEPVLVDRTDEIGRGVEAALASARAKARAAAAAAKNGTASDGVSSDAQASANGLGPSVATYPGTNGVGSQGPAGGEQVGALVLRGNRLVLVRSLDSPPAWSGMRLPSIIRRADESQMDAAVRAASELCDIDGVAELEPMPSLAPVFLHIDACNHVVLFPMYAARAPPPGPLEEADLTDDEDYYDWYTWPRAMHALRHDKAAVAALRTLACALTAGAAAGAVPDKWGGVFGQEWFACIDDSSSEQSSADILHSQAEKADIGVKSSVKNTVKATPKAAAAADPLAAIRALSLRPTRAEGSNAATGATTGAAATRRRLPVSVLSGFLGAGKTTLLTHLLNNRAGVRIALVVNDMADVNVDAALVREGGVLQKDEKMVELSNGCICCTLREDLLSAIASLAAAEAYDYVIVESSGISEPMPVAETFTFEDDSGTSLSSVAILDNLITVVDAAAFNAELHTEDDLQNRGWQATEDDARTVSQLLVDQVEFANVIIINKVDLVTSERLGELRALLRVLNPSAELIEATRGAVSPQLLFGAGRFDLARAGEHPAWLAEARHGEHKPETLEFGISSFTFRAARPLHPLRLSRAFSERHDAAQPLHALVRLKGIAWLATRYELQAHASLAGTQFTLGPGAPWWAALDKEVWPEGLEQDLAPLWHEPHGDRQVELVCIGTHMDHDVVRRALEACLLTDAEFDAGSEAWKGYEDPFADEWAFLEAIATAQHEQEAENKAALQVSNAVVDAQSKSAAFAAELK
uniref:CobW C-terminal domain-containing protein n=1 Tax=Chrysotila carterae TaxID=13221 RepID=A0A7S4BA55_CHRCT